MTERAKPGLRADPSPSLPIWVVPAIVLIVTFAAFFPGLQNGFVNYDDRQNIYENPSFRGLGWDQIQWMFTTFHMAHYQPLSWLTFGLDYTVWGLRPFGYHLTNLLLHLTAALLFYFVSLRLLRSSATPLQGDGGLGPRIGAGAAALLFAVHPLRVESVVWITERRDVLSGSFFLLSILAYLHAIGRSGQERQRWLFGAVASHALSLFSKVLGVTLPAVLLLLDIYPLRRLPWDPRRWSEKAYAPILREKVPFALLSFVFAMIAPFAQVAAGSLEWASGYGIGARIAIPLYGLAFYLWKTILPIGLSQFYALPRALDPFELRFVLSGVVVVAVSAAAFAVRRRWPAFLAAWVYYVVVLSPMLGIVQIGVAIAADRFTYLPCLGWALLAGAGVSWLWRAAARGDVPREVCELGLVGAGVAIALLSAQSFGQSLVWRDSVRLWRHAAAIAPDEAETRNWFGIALKDANRIDEAIEQYRAAVRLRDDFDSARVNLGNVLALKGDDEGAAEQFAKAAALTSTNAQGENNWGYVLMRLGRTDEAIPHFEAALRLLPGMTSARLMLVEALIAEGSAEEALALFDAGLGYGPPDPETADKLASSLPPEHAEAGIALLEKAARSYPEAEAVRVALAAARARQGRLAEAASLIGGVLSRNPSSVRAYRELAGLCLTASLHANAWEIVRAGLAVEPRDPGLQASAERAREGLVARQNGGQQWSAALASGIGTYELALQLAAAHLEGGNREAARRVAGAALSLRPDGSEAGWLSALADSRAPEPRTFLPAPAQRATRQPS